MSHRGPAVHFNELYLELSNVCNAECDHCYVASGPRASRERLSPDLCGELIAAVAASELVRNRVVLAGGEPTLHWAEMLSILRAARQHGVASCIITNAWWGRSARSARTRAAQLAETGLESIEVSLSPYHARFVPPGHVQTVLDALVDQGIRTTLLVRYDTAGSAAQLLDQLPRWRDSQVYSGPVAPVGRGASLPLARIPAARIDGLPEGACGHDLSLTVTPTGDVFPCCCGSEKSTTGVLRLGNVYQATLSELLADRAVRPVVECLARIGPAELVRGLAADGYDTSWAGAHPTICSLCVGMFDRPAEAAAAERVSRRLVASRPAAHRPGDPLRAGRRAGVLQPSGARVLVDGHVVAKTAAGPAGGRLRQQAGWLRWARANGVDCVPEVVGVRDDRAGFGYLMPRYNPIALPAPAEVERLARMTLDQLESVWRLPATGLPPVDATGYARRVADVLADHAGHLVDPFLAAGGAVADRLTGTAPRVVHGDPTFENVALEPMSGGVTILDPNPQQPPAVCLPELDVAKVLQSAAGWERFVQGGSGVLRPPEELRPLVEERTGTGQWSAVVWLMISHLIRTLPYGAKVGDPGRLLPSIEGCLGYLAAQLAPPRPGVEA